MIDYFFILMTLKCYKAFATDVTHDRPACIWLGD